LHNYARQSVTCSISCPMGPKQARAAVQSGVICSHTRSDGFSRIPPAARPISVGSHPLHGPFQSDPTRNTSRFSRILPSTRPLSVGSHPPRIHFQSNASPIGLKSFVCGRPHCSTTMYDGCFTLKAQDATQAQYDSQSGQQHAQSGEAKQIRLKTLG